MNFQFADKFIHLLWTVPTVLVLLYYAASRRKSIITALLGSKMGKKLTVSLNKSARRRKQFYFSICWILLIFSLARPWWGEKLTEEKVSSRDILVCLDTSRSMLAKDISPTRLDHAKWWLKDLANRCPGDRFGLINFAGTAIIECPLTSSSSSFLDYLSGTDTDNIPTGGTNIGSALDTALQAFKGAEGAHRAVILVSDGDELEGDSSERLDEFKEEGIPVIAVGLGDPNQPGVIELPDGKILKDKEGNPVISKLNEKGLIRIATKTNGLYVRTTVANPMTDKVYDRIMELTPESKDGTKKNRHIERYQYPLFVAFIFLMGRLFVGERRKKVTLLITLFSLSFTTFGDNDIPLGLVPETQVGQIATSQQQQQYGPIAVPQQQHGPTATPAKPQVQNQQQAAPKQPTPQELRQMQAIKERKAEILLLEHALEALEKVKIPDQQEIDKTNFNIGVLYQKNGDMEKATDYYEKISTNPHKDLLKRAMNNLSAVELQKAITLLGSDPTKALESLDQAQYYLKRAMSSAGGDKEIIENIKNNLQALFKYRETAKQMKKMQEMVEKMFKDTVENIQKATEQQQKAEDGKNLAEQTKPIPEIEQKINVAQKSLQQLTKIMEMGKMPEEQLNKFKGADEDLNRAKENLKKQLMPLSDQRRKEMSNATKKDLIAALTKLGVPPEQQKKQGDESKDQEKKGDENKDQKGEKGKDGEEKKSQDFDQAAKDLQESEKNKEPKEGSQKMMKEQKIDKKQAESILRVMKEKEQDLKEKLKEMQKLKHNSRGQTDKNW